MSGIFVLSMGRSGSTMLSRMVRSHPEICSISEYWTSLFMRSFGDPEVSGAEMWRLLAEPPRWFRHFVEKAQAANAVPSELIYDASSGRYPLCECPPILTMTLPALSQTPDALFDGLAGTVRTWPRARISVQSRRLFELLAQRTGRGRWLERSGLSHYYLPDLLTGFPKARYVHLTRDGREVILSMMGMRLFDPVVRTAWMMQLFKRGHMRRRIYFRQRALGRRLLLNFVALENVLTRQHRRARPYSLPDRLSEVRRYRVYARFWANTMEMALEAMQEIPSDRLHTMRYEDLVARPRAELERLSEFLEPGVDRSAWIESLAGMPEVRPGRWPRLDPALAAEAEEIIGPVNRLLGYG